MNRIFTALFITTIQLNLSFSQTNDVSPLAAKLLLSANGGITIPQTDFKDIKVSPMGIGAVEYYFSIKSKHALGIRFFGGAGTIKGVDDRHSPSEFTDNFFFIGGGVVYSYAINEYVLPYLFIGASNVWYNPHDKNGNPIVPGLPASESLSNINYNGELGLKINISRRVAVSLSGGEFICPVDQLDGLNAGKHNDFCSYVTAGISIAFFGQTDSDGDGVWDSEDACPGTPSGVEVDLSGCPVDSDNDGVPDYIDKCSQTPYGVEVNSFGCPVDSDNDGIPDYLDNCPDSPPGAPVDALGCVEDSDNDNVPDYLDNCPDTPAGVEVDSAGCPEDMNQNGIPDYLETRAPEKKQMVEKPEYDLKNEHLVRDMIFSDGKLYTAQISAWRDKSKAETEARKLKEKGYNAFVARAFIDELEQTWYRVRVGYFKTFREAQNLAQILR